MDGRKIPDYKDLIRIEAQVKALFQMLLDTYQVGLAAGASSVVGYTAICMLKLAVKHAMIQQKSNNIKAVEDIESTAQSIMNEFEFHMKDSEASKNKDINKERK